MKLLDQMRRSDFLHRPWWVQEKQIPEWQAHARQLRPFIDNPHLPAILIDNVADYYFTGTDQENWDLEKHFPNLAPPFEMFWMEHKLPKKIVSELGDQSIDYVNGRAGVLIFGTERQNITGDGMPENIKWVLSMELFIDYGLRHDGVVEGPHGTFWIGVDQNGVIVDCPWMHNFADPSNTAIVHALFGWTHPALLGVCFMHCKNVTVENEPMHPKHAKEVRKRHGIEPVKFRRLIIEPLKQILRREGNSDTKGVPHAMHICRGHFKDYREGKGLFGKYHKIVWQPQVVRGSKGTKLAPREMEIKV